jgi:conjugal transfer pilus assembly protein TraK
MIRSIRRVVLLTSLLSVSVPALALQVLEGADGQSLIAKISQKELTRVMVEGNRIKRVTGNPGEFWLEKDEDKGQIYIRPASDSLVKPINLFISTERGTFMLLLQPVDLPAETIVIKPLPGVREASSIEKSSSYVRVMKNLLLAMAGDALPRDMEVRESGREIALWKNVRFTFARAYLGQGIVGEKYLLTNLSNVSMTVAEQELYKAGVMAVAVENSKLNPAQSTNVFIIRSRTDRD